MSAPPVDPRFQKGVLFAGRYVIDSKLGQGGLGVVLGAYHPEMERLVAIKVLLGEVAKDANAVARFKQEAQVASSLTSPNIVRVLDLGRTEEGEPFIVMEHLKGRDLAGVIDDDLPTSVPDAVDLVCQACVGVATAHAAGLVHRDLKPANLFLAQQPDGSSIVKVLDFGLTKVVRGDTRLTQDGTSFGTPQYMAPEQMDNARDVDARCDQHALGMILFELLTKHPAYQANTPHMLTVAIVTGPIPSARVHKPEVPEALDNAIQRTLAKNPAERFDNLSAFVHAIAPFGGPGSRLAADIVAHTLRYQPPTNAWAITDKLGADGATPPPGLLPLSSSPTQGAFSTGHARRGKASSNRFMMLGAIVVLLGASMAVTATVIRYRGGQTGRVRQAHEPVADTTTSPVSAATSNEPAAVPDRSAIVVAPAPSAPATSSGRAVAVTPTTRAGTPPVWGALPKPPPTAAAPAPSATQNSWAPTWVQHNN